MNRNTFKGTKFTAMTSKNNNITTLHDLFDYEASKFTSAEIQLQHMLPHWISKARSVKLKNVLQKYKEYIEQHLEKLETIIKEEQISSLAVTNYVMRTYIEEGNEKIAKCMDAEVADACLLAIVQSINHFKISTYGTAAAFARELEMDQQATVFYGAEINEKQIDDRLSQLAHYEINIRAKAPVVLPA